MIQRMFVGVSFLFAVALFGPGGDTPGTASRAAAQEAGKARFEIYQDAGKDWRWRLKGTDDKVLATPGQSFAAVADCRKSVDRMKNLGKQKFEVYEDKGKEFRWRLVATNGQVVAASGGAYATKAACEAAIETVRKVAPAAAVLEEKAKK